MTEGEWVAVIGGAQAILVALIGTGGALFWRSFRRRADAIRYEITNDHEKPLREDMDEKHGELVKMLRRDVGGIREDIRLLRRDLTNTNERLNDIDERTHPK